MDQARNTIVDESDNATATKSQNHSTISGIASATCTKSAEFDSTSCSTSSCTVSKKLRKGKWTIEEEEYTSRIIQYFSTGLLTLPDGATLRSYLAEKLNCDPMRITKKFTGACCLGRRAYHLRDRPRASFAEVDMANLELLHLEQRFRLRVEHEQTGLPLPPQHYKLLASQAPQPLPPQATVVSSAELLPSLFSYQQQHQHQQQSAAVVATPIPTANANNNPWLQQQNSTIPPNLASLLPGLTGNISNTAYSGFNLNTMAGQLLLQNRNERAHTGNPAIAATPSPQLQVLNSILASLNFSQVLANQQAGVSQLQHHGSIASPSNSSAAVVAPSPVAVSAAPTTSPISSTYAAPISTFYPANITANSSITNNRTAISMPVPCNNQEQHSEQVQLYQKQLEKKNLNSSTVPGSGSTKEERAKQLKAAFEEQQRALRLAYEKSLRDAQEQDREERSFSPDSAAAITSDSSNEKVATASTNCNSSSNTKIPPDTLSPAEQLQRSYEAHLESLRRDEQHQASLKPSPKPLSPPSASTSISVAPRIENGENKPENQKKYKKQEQLIQEKTPDEEAGTILLGFLNSLRESFQDAVESKDGRKITTKGRNDYDNKNEKYVAANPATNLIPTDNANNNKQSSTVMTGVISGLSSRNRGRRNGNNHVHSHVSSNIRRQNSDPMTSLSHFQTSKKRKKIKPASVTETSSSTSSHPTTEQSSNSSSQEDSKSDKMGNSSSEESSEKESVESSTTASRRTSKGPPRKRLKGFHEPHAFTKANLMAHSKRMDRECEESRSSSSSDE